MSVPQNLTSTNARVLQRLAEGSTCRQLLRENPDLSREDICKAASAALALFAEKVRNQTRQARKKAKYTNAYQPWTTEDDDLLLAMYAENRLRIEMAEHFKRQPTAITARLDKLLPRISKAD